MIKTGKNGLGPELKDLSDFGQNQIWHEVILMPKLKRMWCHPKNAWSPWRTPFKLPQAPSNNLSSAKQVLPDEKARLDQVINL